MLQTHRPALRTRPLTLVIALLAILAAPVISAPQAMATAGPHRVSSMCDGVGSCVPTFIWIDAASTSCPTYGAFVGECVDQGPAYSGGQIVTLSTNASCPPTDPVTGTPNSLLWSAVSMVDGTTLASGVSAPASSALLRLPDPNDDLTRLHSYSTQMRLVLSCTGGFSGFSLHINFTPCPNGCNGGPPHYLTISPTSGASGTTVALFTDCRPTDLMYGNVIAEPSGTASGWSLYLGKGSPGSETIHLGTAPYLVAPGDTWFYLTAGGIDPLTGVSANCGGSAAFTFIDPVTAGFTFHPVASLPLTVDFDAGSSGGMPTAWSWSFGDGSTGTGLQPRHHFPARGSYSVTLTVSRGAAVTDSVTKTVEVAPPLVVNTTADDPPANPAATACDTGKTVASKPACSLRAAILTANALGGGEIDFAIPGGGVPTISMTSGSPPLTHPTLVDATTQPGGRVELNGTAAGADATGVTLSGGGSTVRGLVIGGFGVAGISIEGGAGNTVAGNLIGTTPDGAVARPNPIGVAIKGASGNTVGGSGSAERNTIVATGAGVIISGATGPANGNAITGNLIGTNSAGTASLITGAASAGVIVGALGGGAADNRITANTVSGTRNGIAVVGPSGSGTVISDNHIGTNSDGSAVITGGVDAYYGVRVDGTPGTHIVNNIITGPYWAVSIAGNVQADNPNNAGPIFYPPQDNADGSGATNTATTVDGNTIGLMADGITVPATRGSNGVFVWAGASNLSLTNNVIAAHSNRDVVIDGGSGHHISGNTIGADRTGVTALGVGPELVLRGTDGALVGTDGDPVSNTINGIGIDRLGSVRATGTVVQHNHIGVSRLGDAPLQGADGVSVTAADNTTIGPGNVISGNFHSGIHIGDGTATTSITLNRIGLAANTDSVIANGAGIEILAAAATTVGPGNVISGNTGAAILSAGTKTVIRNNLIGVPSTGDTNLGNGIGVIAQSGDLDVESNSIAHSGSGAGVAAGPGVKATILHNRIWDNGGVGIVSVAGGKVPHLITAARVSHVDPVTHATSVRTWLAFDKLQSPGGNLEIFGNPDCSNPEGRTPLFSKPVPSGAQNIVITVVNRPELKGFTATLTSPDGYTTAFTSCATPDTMPDANGDGLPDVIEALSPLVVGGGTRPEIATFPNDAGDWVVIHAPAGTQLTGVGPVDDPAPGSHPAGLELPIGLITFTVTGVTPGAPVNVDVASNGPAGASYWRYGPAAPGAVASWHEWGMDTATGTGAEATLTGWRLHFVDGARGDDDGLANGVIHDPGGPATARPAAITVPPTTVVTPPVAVTPSTPSTGAGESSGASAFGSLLLAAGILVLILAARCGRRRKRNVAYD